MTTKGDDNYVYASQAQAKFTQDGRRGNVIYCCGDHDLDIAMVLGIATVTWDNVWTPFL